MKSSKRTVSIILVLALVFSSISLFSLSASAGSNVEGTATYAALEKIGETSKLHLAGSLEGVQSPITGRPISISFTVDADETDFSIQVKYSFLKFHFIYLDEKLYIAIPTFRLVSVYEEGTDENTDTILSSAKRILFRLYNESTVFEQDFRLGETAENAQFLGKSYAMEEIIENTPKPSFKANVYFNSADKEIKGMHCDISDNIFDISISSLTNDADSSALQAPVGYFDFSLIVMFLVNLILG